MTIWRMSFRCGNQGYEMWPHCLELGIAAITYHPLEEVDLSKYPKHEPRDLWAQLAPSQHASLSRVAYEMKVGDIIYVKQGPRIVGRGAVTSPYHFNYKYLVDPDDDPWSHQVLVDWESGFEPIDILLGAEPTTVLELSGNRLQRLEDALINRIPFDEDPALPEEIPDTTTLHEGARRQVSVNAYERSPEARRQCIAHYSTNCSVCGFSFADVYGETGAGTIQVHHLKPLSEVSERYRVDPIRDLRPVCPNCHVVIHKRTPPYSIEEVKALIHQAREAISH